MTEPQNPFEQPAQAEPVYEAQPVADAQQSYQQTYQAQQPAGQYQGYTQTADGQYAPGYQQPYGYQQPGYQQAYQQPVAPVQAAPLYPMTETDRNLRLVAFIFCILSLVGSCWLIIPLAWMIPMCVISWGIYKGTKANTVAFDVCTLIFCSLVGGILLLCSNKDR